MKITLRCPMNARVRRDGVTARAFSTERISFVITESDAAHFPVALKFQNSGAGKNTVLYRRSEETGQLMRNVGRVSKIVQDANLETLAEWKNVGYNALFTEDRDSLRSLVRAGKIVWTEDADSAATWSSLSDQGFTDVNDDDVRARVAEAQSLLDGYRIIDRIMWEPCPEPQLIVRRGPRGWATQLVDGHMATTGFYTHYFAADEHGLVSSWMDTLDEAVGPAIHTPGEMACATGFQSQVPGERLNIARLSDVVLEAMVSGADNVADYPSAAIASFAALKTFVEEFDINHDEDHVEEAIAQIERLLELERRRVLSLMKGFKGSKGGLLLPFEDAIALHISRYENRAISLKPVALAPHHPI